MCNIYCRVILFGIAATSQIKVQVEWIKMCWKIHTGYWIILLMFLNFGYILNLLDILDKVERTIKINVTGFFLFLKMFVDLKNAHSLKIKHYVLFGGNF